MDSLAGNQLDADLTSEKPESAQSFAGAQVASRLRFRAALIGGAPRSGTTLLTNLLNENPAAAIMAEYPFERFLTHIEQLFDYEREVTTAIGSRVMPSGPAVATYEPFDSNSGLKHRLRYPRSTQCAEIATSVARIALGKPNAQVIGAKTPLFMLSPKCDLVERYFDDRRYVFVVRNPVDQANSSLNRRNRASVGSDAWHIRSMREQIEELRETLRAIVAFGASWPDRCYCVKYEDLINDQTRTMDRVSRFLGMPRYIYPKLATPERGVRNVLSGQERAELDAVFGDLIESWDALPLTGPVADCAPYLHAAFEPPPCNMTPVGGSDRRYVAGGWSISEPDGIWTDGPHAQLVFGPTTARECLARLELTPFFPVKSRRLGVRITMDKRTLFDGHWCVGVSGAPEVWAFPSDMQRTNVWLPVTLSEQATSVMRFEFDGLSSPEADGLSEDQRRLGFKLHSLSFESVRQD